MEKNIGRRSVVLLLGALCCVGFSLQVAAQQPLAGPEFQVNLSTTGVHRRPSVGMDAEGNFVVVWSSGYSTGPFSPSWGRINGLRYSSDGTPMGGEFQVNAYTTYGFGEPSVGMDADGDFVVVWHSRVSSGTDTDLDSIQARRFLSDGNAVGSEFQVNTYTTHYQNNPAVAMDTDGDFVVVWWSWSWSGTGTNFFNIRAQRYASDGSAIGSEIQADTDTTSNKHGPSVGMDADGDFVIVWHEEASSGTDTDNYGIQARRYVSDGTPVGGKFQVNTYTTGYQRDPAVAMDQEGNFVVAWSSYGSSGTDTSPDWFSSMASIQAQRYASDGSAIGSEFQVNTYTTYPQKLPSVAMDANGDFVVVWQSYGSSDTDTDIWSIEAQIFASDGSAVGSEFQVNTYTTGWQWEPVVATDTDGDFVVVWTNMPSDGTSIRARQYLVTVFADGFESGNTTAWSTSVP